MRSVSEPKFLSRTSIPLSLTFDKAECPANLRIWDLGPQLQGLLMEHIDSNYAEYLHGQHFNPYSQYCCLHGSDPYWVIGTLTEEAYEKITLPLLNSAGLRLKRLGASIEMGTAETTTLSQRELAGIVNSNADARTTLQFLTPGSFKSGGAYQTLPSAHLIFQNLLMRYSQIFEGSNEVDADTVEYLASNTSIARYSLHTMPFKVARNRIPGFMGTMMLDVHGKQTLRGFAQMLFRFGEYAGIGIKTSMGMGSVLIK